MRWKLIAILTILLSACGPSAEERANLTARSLTEQGQRFLSAGLIDEAEDCAKRAAAIPGATDTSGAEVLRAAIAELRYSRTWEKGRKELETVFEAALTCLEEGRNEEALNLIQAELDAAAGAKADCAGNFLKDVEAALNTRRAGDFWKPFPLESLEEFSRNNTLPEEIWDEDWGMPLENPALLAAWKRTLAEALTEEIGIKREEAARAVPQSPGFPFDTNLSIPMEEVNRNPEKWYEKRIYFNNAWVRGGIRRDAEHGYVVSVISPNDTVFPAKVTGDNMIFVVSRSMADELNSLVSADSKIEVKLYAEIERGRVMLLKGQRTFARASVYWVGVLSGGKVQKIIARR